MTSLGSSTERQKLTDEEFITYRAAVAEEGEPAYLDAEKRPNKALKFMWELRRKYNFIWRHVTEITSDGYLQYKYIAGK